MNWLFGKGKANSVLLLQCNYYSQLAFDEMKIREDLVFDKMTGEITGFFD